MKRFSVIFLLTLLTGGVAAFAQLPPGMSGKKISYAYQDPDDGQLKAIFTGENARQLTGSQVLVSGFEMRTFRGGDTNQVELVVQAPECLVDHSTSIASSPGRLRVFTANTNFFITGEGFFCQQTNAILIISNKVETMIQKQALQLKSEEKQARPLAPTFSGDSDEVLNISSDHFQFLYESNLVSYSGNVRVDDARMELRCDVLHIFLNTNKSVDRISAENRVVIINKRDGSRATGERAVYTASEEREMVELIGNPVWREGEREARAEIFVFDRRENIFRAERNAHFKLPRESIGQPQLFAAPATSAPSGELIEIAADVLTFRLPETNGPVQEIIAEKNVVIWDPANESRATASKAIYNEASGLVELTGNPIWTSRDGEIRADVLAVGRTNRMFVARTNVAMKLPALALKNNLQPGNTNRDAGANQIVEVFCNEFRYLTNMAILSGNVSTKMADENGNRTTLACDSARIHFDADNQVETVFAEKNVNLQQLPGSATNHILRKTIQCDLLTVRRSPETGLFTSIHADGNVVGEQVERTKSGEERKVLSANIVDVKFSPVTNQIENAVATGNVHLQKTGEPNQSIQARGQKAVYRLLDSSETVELTGQPLAWTEKYLFSDALVILLDVPTGKISAMPYLITPLTTNASESLLKTLRQ